MKKTSPNTPNSYSQAVLMFDQLFSRHGSKVFRLKNNKDIMNSPSLRYSFYHLAACGYFEKVRAGYFAIKKRESVETMIKNLREYTKNRNSQNSMRKEFIYNPEENQGKFGFAHLIEPAPTMTDEQMIAHLKSKGYKILKPVQQFEEI